SINKLVNMQTSIRNSIPSLDVIYNDLIIEEIDSNSAKDELLLSNPIINSDEKLFRKSIDVENVSFRYPESKEDAIKNVSLSIPIGQSVAFVGQSGSGKTTIVDIILGLLESTSGTVKVDGSEINKMG